MVASWYVYCAKFKIQRTAGEIVKAWIDARNGYTVRSLTHNIVFVRSLPDAYVITPNLKLRATGTTYFACALWF